MPIREFTDIPLQLPEDQEQEMSCRKLIGIIGERPYISWYQGHLFHDGESWVLTGSKLRHEMIAERHLHLLQSIVGEKNLRLHVERG